MKSSVKPIHMNETATDSFTVRFWKSSHRSISEQLVGFGIIVLACLGFVFMSSPLFSIQRDWYQSLKHAPWAIAANWYPIVFTVVHTTSALAFWTLWRRYSLRSLKWELSLFLTMFLFESIWSLSLYGIHAPLLALVALLLWMSSAFCCAALLWKKERLSGQFLFPLILWIFYLVSVNMVLCIANP